MTGIAQHMGLGLGFASFFKLKKEDVGPSFPYLPAIAVHAVHASPRDTLFTCLSLAIGIGARTSASERKRVLLLYSLPPFGVNHGVR